MYGLYPSITKPSRITTTSATLIDNIFTNKIFDIQLSGLLCNDISDHLPIYCVTKQEGVNVDLDNKFVFTRIFNDKNLDKFKTDSANHNWDTVFNHQDVNIAYDYFNMEFCKMFEYHFPKKKVHAQSKCLSKQWLSKGLKNACKKKNSFIQSISFE